MTDLSGSDPAPVPAVAPARAPWWWPNMRDTLALLSTLTFAATLLAPLIRKDLSVDPDLKGAIVLQWGAVMGWYFGSSKGSAAKDATIAALSSSGPDQ